MVSDSHNAHKRIRCSCKYCILGYYHHKHHDSHGEGSFRRTHPGYCKTNTCNSPKSPNYKRKKTSASSGCHGRVDIEYKPKGGWKK